MGVESTWPVCGASIHAYGMSASRHHPTPARCMEVKVRLTEAAHQRLRAAARANDRTLQAEARTAIVEHLERVLRGPEERS